MVYMTGGLMRINEMLPNLSPSGKKIAMYILENPQEIISLTANELGKRSSTSGAAVIRLCKSLNLKGFHELKIRVAGDLQKTTQAGVQDIEPNEATVSIIEKMTNNSIQTIRETAELIRVDELEWAVRLLEKARRIHFIGVGASSIIAQDAEQKFLRINKTAYAFEDMHLATTLVANAEKDDVVVGISFSGETEEVANILQLARENGAATISLTKYGKWPVTEQADINLYTSATREPTFRSGAMSSRMSQLQVIDILFMCVASLEYEKSIKHLAVTRDAIESLKLNMNKNSTAKKAEESES
ncbi:MurR/RpiR family transcriptional regulator [Oceanobacillus jeddahense]|uniref:MurR/RpiR family transcriptional regulator n=1 Tax=Oceanobacillus jeddahense TaxID=1462527 RepID=A0ABY5K393_9BACI|nr:MurR/RpiR family transcriptional regulator [Oceanobacillus jeddahense]UUI05632.1 MurR/RpiR family transcriptional regulator [Oceanobacillus jeddahense]